MVRFRHYVGGDGSVDEYHTLPNIIKKFSPNLKGFSVNKGKVDSTNARLNVAVPGNKSSYISFVVYRDMPGQARLLVQRMNEDPEIDMDNDWKIITVFIGGNDLCDYCDDPAQYSAETYKGNIQEALDILHENVPKAFVNLVEVLNIANVNQLNSNPICDVLHL
ncbi:hypothetical protein KUTeg_014287 [Tegillarca granosa]|uniref:Uncharacterized protein n=1 Tax=Tegillarca granosa TaxID=220873 RepID=A0ABQ9EW74_TEGGR|nr:hypothetical protein KUTeg_014287 [Tegillarca granosa]